MRPRAWVLSLGITGAAASVCVTRSDAQALERRILEGGHTVQFTFAAREGACGDGATFIVDGLGDGSRITEGGIFNGRTRSGDALPCLPGPVRVVASVVAGSVTRLRTFVGPVPTGGVEPERDVGAVSVEDAVTFLTRIAEEGTARVAAEALLPIVLADSIRPWPTLLRLARDAARPHTVRQQAAFLLSRGAAATVGVADADVEPDDEVRESIVFAISQQPRDEAVPRLLQLARVSPHAVVRAQALFWLGQSGDPRALDLFAEILRGR